jgi:hypothetical protein
MRSPAAYQRHKLNMVAVLQRGCFMQRTPHQFAIHFRRNSLLAHTQRFNQLTQRQITRERHRFAIHNNAW